ncbi:MAG: TonB-dependent receptor, partial [Calditrichia bacterium]|nr:TonB-dependent receptor [Calditrichia bacterium]
QNRYHDLNSNGIQDPGEPFVTFAERQQYWYQDTKSKTKFSPRLGASFPITATGVIHFSYGHFFQIPNFELLYRNPQFKMDTRSGSTNLGIIGNADLRPQQTISGEIGLQQQLGTSTVIDGTIFFRDVRDLAGTRADQIPLISGETYSRLVNSDFGFVQGFIISMRNRYSMGINYTVDYTFQIAKGTASDPDQARNAVAGGALPEVRLTALSWDQRHTLNGSIGYNRPTWGLSFIGRLGSGQPYTPRQGADVATIRENSQKKPTFWKVDMRLFKDFRFFAKRFSLFLRVFNLFDVLNEVNVYDDTGRAGFTTDLERNRASNPEQNVNSIDEWYINITHYSEPRRIEFGFIFDF